LYLKYFLLIAIAAAFVLGITGIEAQQAFADVIDFETGFVDKQAVGAVTTVTNTVTFGVEPCTNPTSAFIAKSGTPQTAYFPKDKIPATRTGSFFLSDEKSRPLTVTLGYCISFATPVKNLSLDLYDYHDSAAGVNDFATLSVFAAGANQVGSAVFVIPAGTPDPNVAPLSIQNPTGLISSAQLSFSKPDVGTGIDNITFTTQGGGGSSSHEPPTIGKNLAGDQQMVTNGICIDAQCWTVTQNFHVDFELVEMLTSPHTISNTIYCNFGVDKCNHITLSAGPYQEDINAAIWKVSVDKNFLGELTVTVDDPDGYLGDTTCTAQIIEEKYWGTSCTIDFKKPMPGMMLGVQVWDTYKGVRNFYFNDGIEIIDTYGYPYVDTEFEPSLDVPRLCLVDNPDKRISCAFAEKVQLEIERAEKLLTE